MKQELKAVGGGIYDSPQCTCVEIHAEGLLCSSFEQLSNEFDYNWDEQEG